MKQCKKCKIKKQFKDFTKDKNYSGGTRHICKKCAALNQKRYWSNNPDQYKKHLKRVKEYDAIYKQRLVRHNLPSNTYDSMLSKHGGLCWACKDRAANSIDHDHSCCDKQFSCGNCIRGLLCGQCNTALGLLQDSEEKIRSLLEYLRITGVSSNG